MHIFIWGTVFFSLFKFSVKDTEETDETEETEETDETEETEETDETEDKNEINKCRELNKTQDELDKVVKELKQKQEELREVNNQIELAKAKVIDKSNKVILIKSCKVEPWRVAVICNNTTTRIETVLEDDGNSGSGSLASKLWMIFFAFLIISGFTNMWCVKYIFHTVNIVEKLHSFLKVLTQKHNIWT